MSLHDYLSEDEARALKTLRGSLEAIPLAALVVAVGNETYALPAQIVTALYENIPLTELPGMPAFVVGIASIEGRVLPVVNLATFLTGIADVSPAPSTLVNVADDTVAFAFQVEVVSSVNYLLSRSLGSIPPTVDIENPAYVEGVLPGDTLLLNMDVIFDDLISTVNFIVDRNLNY